MHTQNRNGSNYFFVGKWEILPLSVTRHFEKRSHFKLKSQEKKSFITQIYVSLRQLKSSFPTVAICGSRERKKKRILRSRFHNLPAFTETDQTKISYNKGSHFLSTGKGHFHRLRMFL